MCISSAMSETKFSLFTLSLTGFTKLYTYPCTHSPAYPPTHTLTHSYTLLFTPRDINWLIESVIGKQNAPFSKQLQEHLHSVRKVPRTSNYRCSLVLMTAWSLLCCRGGRRAEQAARCIISGKQRENLCANLGQGGVLGG